MDYKKAYKEALERAREFQKSKDGLCVLTAESIFPELKESEDEKIRKWLLDTITQIPNDSIEWDVIEKAKVLSWLEKQGEKKATDKVNPTLEDKVNILADKIIDLRLMVKALEIQAIRQCSDKNRLDSLESMVFQMSEIYKTPDKAGDNVTLKDMKS